MAAGGQRSGATRGVADNGEETVRGDTRRFRGICSIVGRCVLLSKPP